MKTYAYRNIAQGERRRGYIGRLKCDLLMGNTVPHHIAAFATGNVATAHFLAVKEKCAVKNKSQFFLVHNAHSHTGLFVELCHNYSNLMLIHFPNYLFYGFDVQILKIFLPR